MHVCLCDRQPVIYFVLIPRGRLSYCEAVLASRDPEINVIYYTALTVSMCVRVSMHLCVIIACFIVRITTIDLNRERDTEKRMRQVRKTAKQSERQAEKPVVSVLLYLNVNHPITG